MKVVTLVGTRPEIIKLSLIAQELDRTCDHVLVHSGQNFDDELSGAMFRDLGLRKPDHFLDAGGTTPAQMIARVIERFDDVLAVEQPDAMLLLGDTNTGLGIIAAKRRKIPIFHMEAGNRCFDQRVPEEINRRIIDHTSDVNLTYTEHARRYLLSEGLRPETVIKTGSPMREVLDHHRQAIADSTVLSDQALEAGRYFVVSAHREENVDMEENLRGLITALDLLIRQHGMPVLVSTHPRTGQRLAAMNLGRLNPLIRFAQPFRFFDYVKLEMNAACVISDSGTLTEEASILGFPSVMIRNAHERPEGMDEATVVMSGLAPDSILAAVTLAMQQHERGFRPRLVEDYAADLVSTKVVRIIFSYAGYVRRTVWREAERLAAP
ncbi:UDP-N-acetyl glucosamine 2-epimerase [Agaricicola taiwanensis]|uniref:UDP-N-acetyl glucosamine 2-epimerase n=1 Tax=Agaricicola taiwanensis TaxID=591372 RepID=A0A8J2VS68_9RHOB|nr:UDP-N-acetyl glucosamine 2-epimerase [Agaricicola taiwanensis]GGE39828.1 UDP-N-acetyl glucosamine 2-epimerase [Agaricicola taiwanensis]